jgi:peptidoglycan hydrolase CwlO-like protein
MRCPTAALLLFCLTGLSAQVTSPADQTSQSQRRVSTRASRKNIASSPSPTPDQSPNALAKGNKAVVSESPTPTPTPSPSPVASASSTKSEMKLPELLTWLKEDRPGFWGILFFVFGTLGGLITAAFSLGDSIPGIGGANVIDADQAKVDALEDKLNRRQTELDGIQVKIAANGPDAQNLQFVATQHMQQINAIQSQVQQLQARISSNRWAAWKFGMPIYVIVGGGTSLLLAKDVLQALVFGATWTSVVSAIGLKSNADKKQVVQRQAASDLANKIEQLSKENSGLKSHAAVLETSVKQTAEIAAAAMQRISASPTPPAASTH